MKFLKIGKRMRCIVFTAAFCAALPASLRADAEQDWKKITAMDAGPEAGAKTRDEALKLTLSHLAAQQKALVDFIKAHPGDAHGIEARLRLSHILSIRSDLESNPQLYTEALKILDDLLASSALPPEKKSDVAYARITLFMHHAQNPDESERDALLSHVLQFKKDYPTDHRNGALLAEMASAYDSQPEKKRDLLNEALRYADTPELKARIGDDLKRLGMLGHPLKLKFDSVQGDSIDLDACRGKVVLVYFFAGWSTPSVLGLQPVKDIADHMPKNQFQLLCISLDEKKETAMLLMKKTGLDCPVYFDGKGWESPLARELGINALPTVWLVDKKGNLRVLNAINNTEGLVRALMKED